MECCARSWREYLERPTHWKMDIGYGTWDAMNLIGQDTENSCKRKLDLVGVKGSDGTRLAINRQMIVHFSVE
jgi:hypothetical protein